MERQEQAGSGQVGLEDDKRSSVAGSNDQATRSCKSFEGHQMLLRSLYMPLTWDQMYANVFNFVVIVKFQVIMRVLVMTEKTIK